MRERTLLRLFPELKTNQKALEEAKKILSDISDTSYVNGAKNWKKEIKMAITNLIVKKRISDKEVFWRTQLKLLEDWTEKRGIILNFQRGGETEFVERFNFININSSLCAETQLYFALHECGHYLLSNSKNYNKNYPFYKYNKFQNMTSARIVEKEEKIFESIKLLQKMKLAKEKHKYGYKVSNVEISKKAERKFYLYSSEYCILKLQEEIEAWERGKKLADRLQLFINENNFSAKKLECLESYMDWAVLERNPCSDDFWAKKPKKEKLF
jgi:Zn-dependent peptidase ImmA (M78 family)